MINLANVKKLLSGGTEILALYLREGEQLLWQKAPDTKWPVTFNATGSKLDIVDDIYVGVGNKLIKYDLNGNLVWSRTVTGTITTVLNIDQVIIVGTDVGWVFSFDYSGNKYFDTNVGFGITGFALAGDALYVTTKNGAYKYALDGQKIQDLSNQFDYTLGKISSTRLIIAIDLGTYRELNCLDLSLNPKWAKQDLPNAAISADVYGADFVIGYQNGSLDRITESGQVTWSKSFSGDINTVFVGNTNIYIGTSAKIVYKLDNSGGIIWQKTMTAPVTDLHVKGNYLFAIVGTKIERMDA